MSTMSYGPLDDEAYAHRPLPQDSTPSGFNSNVNLPLDNPSTDQLLAQPERSDTYRARRQPTGGSGRGYHRPGQSDAAPLLDYAQPLDGANDIPYPPSAYNQPPLGYMPPTLRRTATDASSDSEGTRKGSTRWDGGDGPGQRYPDPYGAYQERNRPGYQELRRPSDQEGNTYGEPRSSGY